MPVWNWFKIHQTDNLTYLRKIHLTKKEYNRKLEGIWFEIYDEFLERFGMTDELKQLLRLKFRRINHLCDYIIKDEKFGLTEAEMIQTEIEDLMSEGSDVDDDETIIMIESQIGFKINPKEISVVEYYNYLNFITKQAKSQLSNGKN